MAERIVKHLIRGQRAACGANGAHFAQRNKNVTCRRCKLIWRAEQRG